jgi:hypothetical protein
LFFTKYPVQEVPCNQRSSQPDLENTLTLSFSQNSFAAREEACHDFLRKALVDSEFQL